MPFTGQKGWRNAIQSAGEDENVLVFHAYHISTDENGKIEPNSVQKAYENCKDGINYSKNKE